MIIKILAVLGIIFIFFCVSVALAVLTTGWVDDTDPEEDREQMEYIENWRKRRDSH